VIQIYMNIAIFITSWLVLTYNPFVFTPWGILSAALWITSSLLSIVGINNIGLALAQGIWSGSTILVSFLWGALWFNKIKNIGLAVLGLILLLLGIFILALSNTGLIEKYFTICVLRRGLDDVDVDVDEEKEKEEEERSRMLVPSHDSEINSKRLSIGPDEEIPAFDEKKTEEEEPNPRKPLLGLAAVLLLGITNGSMLVPLQFAPKDASGISYLVSFGIGIAIVTPFFVGFYCLFTYLRSRTLLAMKPKIAAIPGLVMGVGWNIGNASSIYAVSLRGFAVGFSLTQTSLLIGGLWGIFFFREMKTKSGLLIFAIGTAILFAGIILLGLFGGNG